MRSKRQASTPARWRPYAAARTGDDEGSPRASPLGEGRCSALITDQQRSLSFYLLDFSLNLLRFDFFISDILSLSLPTTTYRIRIYRFRGLECYDLSLF